MLSDDPSLKEGQDRVRVKIMNRVGVTPSGIRPPKVYDLLYNNGGREAGFGRSTALRCPYYSSEKGSCTIWKFRESTCSTWFCKHVANEKGKVFWEAMRSYMHFIQEHLVDYTLLRLGFVDYLSRDKVSALDINEIEDKVDETRYRILWKNYFRKEEELYMESYRIVSALTREQVQGIAGIKNEIYVNRIKEKHKDMTTLPEYLILNPFSALKDTGRNTYKVKLRKIDVEFELHKNVFKYFDGTISHEKALVLLDKEEAIMISRELLIALYHHNILISLRAYKQLDISTVQKIRIK